MSILSPSQGSKDALLNAVGASFVAIFTACDSGRRGRPSRSFTLCAANAALVLIAAWGCGSHPETFGGAHAAIDAGTAVICETNWDSGCALPPRCETNADCLAALAPRAPSGILYATCWGGSCMSAEECVDTHAGAPSYCTCGDTMIYLSCGLCMAVSEADEPEWVPYCR